MIWDRFDDAHDDLINDIRDNERKVEELQAELGKAGISYTPFEQPKPHNEPGPQGWYEDSQREEVALAIYQSYLSKLLNTASR